MDDDLVDVLIVFIVLAFGVVGLLILLATTRCRQLLRCCGREEELPIKPKRTTIRVIQKANSLGFEEGRVAVKAPVTRVVSSPLPMAKELTTPVRAKELIFIVPRSPTYRAEMGHSCNSTYVSNSTGSSYLPSQIPPMMKRRCST
ncbi:hypothetical protein Q1695_009034 [Nippostrongylus brasiliensis]|nr:hypothetical protein Q1695_009034 [Nippostrongylus brasiliensis]